MRLRLQPGRRPQVLGRARRQHQDWFDDNDADINNLLAEKNGLHKAYMDLRTDTTKAAFFRCRRLVQQRPREMQDVWMVRKAEKIEGFISDAAIDRLPQVDTNNDLDLPPSLPETIRAVQQISSGKAPGSNAIPPEVYKHGGPRLLAGLTTLLQDMWRQGQVPQDFKDATIVPHYKRKGIQQLCDNHRGIAVLKIAWKIFTRILLNRLNGHLEQGLLPESKCGFHRHHGTTDMIFAARQLQEKCKEMRTHLYTTFVDLTKAFDTVNHEGLWKVMQKFGFPERFKHMVLSCSLLCFYRDEQPGIRIAYRTDGHLLNSRRMQALTRVSTATVHDLLFAEDYALNTVTEVDMQRSMDLFSAGCANFGLTISTAKTVVMPQLPPSAECNASRINVNGAQPKNVENFAYLGSTLTRNTRIDAQRVARWQDRILNTKVLERTGILSIHAMLRQVQLRWSGHLVRMDDERLPKRLFYGDVATGASRQGGLKRRYKDTLKKSLKQPGNLGGPRPG
ncbi:unnamed protein product [Schistocephalus solidus]|uniref:Reverse transcriptase domain-containing protein n=1 Tax=Schistocephalus solidus TaxID=70667 RepID=A0A183TGV7_SCHSO|nr:unnamed protein product [Schistocephalus solidus]